MRGAWGSRPNEQADWARVQGLDLGGCKGVGLIVFSLAQGRDGRWSFAFLFLWFRGWVCCLKDTERERERGEEEEDEEEEEEEEEDEDEDEDEEDEEEEEE